MIERSTKHGSFTIERNYPVSPDRVFHAWADPVAKRRWFACHDDWVAGEHDLDFRVGGRERSTTTPPGGLAHIYEALYQDIVADRRIVYSYDMRLGDTRISVSLATIEFEPTPTGTKMLFTEQAVFLDGHQDLAEREEGTRAGLANLDKELLPIPSQ